MDVGKLIKTLRKERQLTQEELAEGITTRTTLASIENRNKDISFDVLLKILDRLNIQMMEFLFLLNEGKHSYKQQLYSEVYSDYYSKGYLSKDVEAKLVNAYQETRDFFYLAAHTQMLAIQLRNEGHLSVEKEKQLAKSVEDVKDHLNRVTNWTHLELGLFTNCLFLFENSYIQAVYKRTVKNLLYRKKLSLFQDDILIFLLNCIDLSLERDEDHLVEYYLNELNEQFTRENQMYEKTLYFFYQAVLDIRKGNSEAIEDIERILEYLKFLGKENQVSLFKQDIEKFTDIQLGR